jgi:hypothetical protein
LTINQTLFTIAFYFITAQIKKTQSIDEIGRRCLALDSGHQVDYGRKIEKIHPEKLYLKRYG